MNPLAYKLPFERFLNPERPKAPDIDMDFADNRRDEMIAYAKEKYGEDHVAQIGTFGTMMARAAVRDVARALGHAYGTGDRIAKLIPMGSQGFPMTIDRALEMEADSQKLYQEDDDVQRDYRPGKAHRRLCAPRRRPRRRRRHRTDAIDRVDPVQFDPKGEGKTDHAVRHALHRRRRAGF